MPKQLTKRWRPNTLHEESSPEDSPPCGGTSEYPNEVECLKLRPPLVYTNQEVINYNKVDPRNLVTLWDRPCYSSAKAQPRKGAMLRGSGPSFIKIGTSLFSTTKASQWSLLSGFTLTI
jgi:hypothetical protein